MDTDADISTSCSILAGTQTARREGTTQEPVEVFTVITPRDA
jgi:hypothetical protein